MVFGANISISTRSNTERKTFTTKYDGSMVITNFKPQDPNVLAVKCLRVFPILIPLLLMKSDSISIAACVPEAVPITRTACGRLRNNLIGK